MEVNEKLGYIKFPVRRVKIIKSEWIDRLEKQVNEFLESKRIENIVDIQYRVIELPRRSAIEYSVMIEYIA